MQDKPEKKLNILFLTPRYPFPLIGGDRLKSFNLLTHLCKHHNVTLVTFFQGESLIEENVQKVKSLGLDLHVVPLKPIAATIKGVLPRLLSQPLEIGYYNQLQFHNKVEELLGQKKFDLLVSFFMRTAEYTKDQSIKKILIAEDCRVVYQQRSYKSTKNVFQKGVRWWDYKRLCKYEPEIVNHFDMTTLVSTQDIEFMKKNNSKANYRLLTNGTDVEHYCPPEDNSTRKGLLFIGKLDVWSNILMAQRIVNDILPQIKKVIPDIELKIVGAKPSKEILRCANESVKVIPDVPDLKPYLQQAQLFIHPHQAASGIQNKVLEAMACGLPVVTSPTGIQGIPAQNGVDVLVANNNEEFISLSLDLLQNKQKAETISRNCRELIIKHRSWQAVYQQMDSIIDELFN